MHGSTSRAALSNSASALFCFRGSKIWFKSISIVQYVQHGTGLLNPSTTPLHCSQGHSTVPCIMLSTCYLHRPLRSSRFVSPFTFPCIRSVFLFSFECITIFKYCSSSTAATTTCGDHPCAVCVFLLSSHGFERCTYSVFFLSLSTRAAIEMFFLSDLAPSIFY